MNLRPMLAKEADKPFDDPAWIFEPKLDGVRALVEIKNKKAHIVSRRGKNLTRQFPEVVQTVSEWPDGIYDGEIVVFREGKPDFNLVQRRYSTDDEIAISVLSKEIPAVFVPFDILKTDRWLLNEPLEIRKEELEKRTEGLPWIREKGRELYEEMLKRGFEGIMAKKLGTPYIPGKRVDFWLKIKKFREIDAVICGFIPGKGERAPYFGSLILGAFKNGKLVHIGNVGTGFSKEDLENITRRLTKLVTPEKPLEGDVEGIWVRPVLVARIRFQEWTKDGKLRLPRFMGLREDKDPFECIIDKNL